MTREDFLFVLAFLLMVEGYLAETVFPALLGMLVILYLYGVRNAVSFSIEGERVPPAERLEEGKWHTAKLHLRNLGGDVSVKPEVRGEDFDVEGLEPFFLPSGGEKTFEYRFRPLRKGRFVLEPVRIIAEDSRGLYVEEFLIGPTVDVSVYPSVESIKEAARVEYNLRLAEVYKRGQLFGAEGLDIKDLREYQHGDDFKRIDWKASVRLGELIVREFIKEENADVYIFLDNTREMRKGLRMAKIDYAAVLALQVAANLVKRYRVGLVVYDEVSADIVSAGKGPTQLETIRRRLDLRGEGGKMSLRFGFEPSFGERTREFLRKVLPLRKGRRGSKGIFEAISLLKNPSFIILITDLSNPTETYRAVAMALKSHRVLILSPNPVLFYGGELDERTLRRLYDAYEERERLLKKFNALAPTIDLGPSDYIKELARVV
ncbi:DUF58 domain-containing protein [Thermococcus sp. ES12]|uniref:DUF58 domain-containing protein n=1 Tax=Thermococcus sp. ES12 TaxID=1638246 RepID=UPI001430EAFA|nr:DUF58 domain-containing protein [Thermococcus sp. ES12]NJE77289.1 DUF58 domain-containing protein [Thermococcus sp. ES12]